MVETQWQPIQEGAAFSLIAVSPGLHSLMPRSDVDLGGGLWIGRSIPFDIADHWKAWIGSLHMDRLLDSGCVILSSDTTPEHGSRSVPTSVDHKGRVLRFYCALALALSHATGGWPPTQLTGRHRESRPEVESLTQLRPRFIAYGLSHPDLTSDVAMLAGTLFRAQVRMFEQGEQHLRVRRINRTFLTALEDFDFELRIFHLVRCLEGFVLPRRGRTERQLKSRTELFLGPEYHGDVGDWFSVRSDVGHLHGALRGVLDGDRVEREFALFRISGELTCVVQHALQRLLLTPELWPWFEDDTRIEAFWNLDESERRQLWGPPMDLGGIRKQFSPKEIPLEALTPKTRELLNSNVA